MSLTCRVLRGHGCPFCRKYATRFCKCTIGKTLASRPDVCKSLHPTLNGELNPAQIALTSGKKLWFKCLNHSTCDEHAWQCEIKKQTCANPTGCPYCLASGTYSRVCSCQQNRWLSTHPVWAEVDEKKTMDECGIDAKSMRRGSCEKIWWKSAKCQHSWKSRVQSRTRKHLPSGCPKCPKERDSFLTRQIIKVLNEIGIEYEREEWFEDCRNQKVLKWDFYFPTLGLYGSLLESDGMQHFRASGFGRDKKAALELRRKLDRIKNIYSKTRRPLLRISGSVLLETVRGEILSFIARVRKAEPKSAPLQHFVGKEYLTADYKKYCL